MSEIVWGIDLGGTKIEGIVAEKSNLLKPFCRPRVPTRSQEGYSVLVGQVKLLVEAMTKESGKKASRIGFGTPGTLDPQLQTMKNSNSTCLNGMPLKRDLESALDVEIEITNDANCFALAENLFGSSKGARTSFGVIMGSGVGGGIVVDGKVWPGLQGIAGEWGHNILIPDGETCYCGKKGCVEAYISGPALEKFNGKLSQQKKSLAEIEQLALQNDPHALATINRLIDYFGRAIAVVINILDPDVVVLGGGVSNLKALYAQGIESAKKHVFNNRMETKILKNSLGDSAGVFGAALL